MSKSKDIVITCGTAFGSVLALAQAIRKEVPCRVFVLGTDRKILNILRSSRYIDEVHWLEYESQEEYIHQIIKWYHSRKFSIRPILYFTTDSSCYHVNSQRLWFEEHFELCLPSSDIITTYTLKGEAEVKADEAGLDVPQTQTITSFDDLQPVKKNFNFPVILKPRAFYLRNQIRFKFKVFDTLQPLSSFLEKNMKEGDSYICQEYIPGGDDQAYYYLFYRCAKGNIYENMGKKIMQSAPKGGIMSKGLSFYDQELSQISKIFLDKIDYIGMGGIEFKKYQGKYYFIEMSVRLEGFYKIAESSKVPLSLISYYDISQADSPYAHPDRIRQKDGVIYVDFISMGISRIKYKKYGALVGDLFNIVFNPHIRLNIFSWKDPIPFIKSNLNRLRKWT